MSELPDDGPTELGGLPRSIAGTPRVAPFIAALLSASACSAVLGLDEFEDQRTAAGSSPAGGEGGADPSTTSAAGLGGAGGAPSECASNCEPPPPGAEVCCFVSPTSGGVCGYLVPEYGTCLPANNPGDLDGACPAEPSLGLAGCCMPNGLCGFVDSAHGLGCVPAEALNDAPASCQSSVCGKYCQEHCELPEHDLPLYACAEQCASSPCVDFIGPVAACTPSATGCTTSGERYYLDCLNEHYDLAACRDEADCGRYCNMVQEACSATQPQYPDVPTCEALCGQLPGGTFPSTDDSIACRMQAAVDGRCAAAGAATAADECGGTCHAYCTLYEKLCGEEFTARFQTAAACASWCAPVLTAAPFVWVAGGHPSGAVQCRVSYLVELAAGASVSCAQIGDAPAGLCPD